MMKSTINLYVYAVFPDGEIVQAGRILSRNLNTYGQYEGFFRYSSSYLDHPKAYPVDPVHLPLADKTFASAKSELGLHEVFDDSLPDAWGRHILARKGGLERSRFAPAHLLSVLGAGGLGRFLFTEKERLPGRQDASIPFDDIFVAIQEAGKLEQSIDTETAELQHLLACGSSAGGARPKVLTRKDSQFWIAKFASRKDIHPKLFVSLEEAGLTLARMAGLDVPEFRRESVQNREILLVKRFDTTPQNGRNALVSFRSLIGVEDQYSVSYSDMAKIVRLYSDQPGLDLEQLYRQMIVNVLLVNTDDHLQNFSMLHTESGWRLSPSYDIVPNVFQLEQILQVNGKHKNITPGDILAEGQKIGLSLHKSKSLLQEVVERISGWEKVFAGSAVPPSHTGKLQEDIRSRFKIFG
ncbi:MAG: type II toxin-antitoxin system HipA family toxin [Desulfobulbaceae bacterium]|nr:type II toxin-antitoxin system HipA family toxin [Desulfobulbaceae bacterium]